MPLQLSAHLLALTATAQAISIALPSILEGTRVGIPLEKRNAGAVSYIFVSLLLLVNLV